VVGGRSGKKIMPLVDHILQDESCKIFSQAEIAR
jgi:hypothetical protein